MRPRTVRVPPGRAGLIWLRRRVAAAERGADQLDRRLRALRPELDRRTAAARASRERWADAATTARLWTARAGVLGGWTEPETPRRGLADIRLQWGSTAGVLLPGPATVTPAPETDVPASNAALPRARDAQRDALVAAAECAVAEDAVARLEAEVVRTRRRLRAVERVWLPWLRDALVVRQLELDQAAQEDVARVRRALGGGSGTRVGR